MNRKVVQKTINTTDLFSFQCREILIFGNHFVNTEYEQDVGTYSDKRSPANIG